VENEPLILPDRIKYSTSVLANDILLFFTHKHALGITI